MIFTVTVDGRPDVEFQLYIGNAKQLEDFRNIFGEHAVLYGPPTNSSRPFMRLGVTPDICVDVDKAVTAALEYAGVVNRQ